MSFDVGKNYLKSCESKFSWKHNITYLVWYGIYELLRLFLRVWENSLFAYLPLHSTTLWNTLCFIKLGSSFGRTRLWVAWVAQSAGRLPLARIVISGSWDRSPCWAPCLVGSLLLPLPFPLVCALSLAHSLSLK